MKIRNTIIVRILFPIIAILGSQSCRLDTQVKEPNFIPQGVNNAPTAPDLVKVYQTLNFLTGFWEVFAPNEMSSDICAYPARGTDWYDGGVWIQFATRTWTPAHPNLRGIWNNLNNTLYHSTLLAETTEGQKQAEGKFIRALATFICCDLFGQVQHRAANAPIEEIPKVYTRSEAIDFVIAELEAAIPLLPAFDGVKRDIATKESARFLLAKAYLNKVVYKATPDKPEGPYSFNVGDMNKVISLCDEIDDNPHLSFSANYWDNFKWDNSTKSKENIFVASAANGAGISSRVHSSFHNNMSPSGWNGGVILPAFFDTFEDADVRKKYNIPGYSEYVGYNAGFLIGQAYGPKGPNAGGNKAGPGIPIIPLDDRGGNPLIFSRQFNLFASTEEKGIRVCKYPLSISNINNSSGYANENDYPIFRFAEARLMKAEAILRGGTSTRGETSTSIVNELRLDRKASALAVVDLPVILAERGRDLFWEGWRRTDLIRFGRFLESYHEAQSPTEASRVVFPIPDVVLDSNPNLKQNFGY